MIAWKCLQKFDEVKLIYIINAMNEKKIFFLKLKKVGGVCTPLSSVVCVCGAVYVTGLSRSSSIYNFKQYMY